MIRTLFLASTAIISIVSPPLAASAQCIRQIDIGDTPDVEVRQTGVITAITICSSTRANSRVAARETDQGSPRDHVRFATGELSVHDQAAGTNCAGNINGMIRGDVTIGSNVKIRAARQTAVTAVAIASSAACNANGVLDSESC